jgi:hypothetical protein
MKFLLVFCMGLFCASMFAQDLTTNQQMPQQTTLADSLLTPKSPSESGQAPAVAQQTPTSENLVDAPSATQQSTCTQKNGKPCPEWVHKLIGPYPAIDVSEPWSGRPDHFFTFGDARRVLHPDKKSWLLFTAAQAGRWASAVIAVRNHRTSHEEAHSEYPAVAFMTGMDFLAFKTISPALSVGAPVYAMIHYSRAATK